MSEPEKDPLVTALESIGKHMGEIKAELKSIRGDLTELGKNQDPKLLSSLEMRTRQVLGAVERLPSQNEGPGGRAEGLAAVQREVQALKDSLEKSARARSRRLLSVGSLLLVALVVFLAGGAGGVLLHRWLVTSEPKVQIDQAARSQMRVGQLLVSQWSELSEREQDLVNEWLRGGGKLPIDPTAGAPGTGSPKASSPPPAAAGSPGAKAPGR